MSDSLDTTTKICKTCGKTFPATVEYFYTAKAGDKVYIRGICKVCYCEISRQEHARRFAENPEKIKQQQRDWLANNPDKLPAIKQSQKEWIARNHDKVLAKNKQWKAANPDRVKAHEKKSALIYHEKHPEVRKAKKSRRRALEANAPGTHTAADILAQVAAQTDKRSRLHCWWCGKVIQGSYHVDHRTALARGGTNWPDNLVISCPTCNLSKNDKSAQEWAGRLL